MKKSILLLFGLTLFFNSFGTEQVRNLMNLGGINLYGVCGKIWFSGNAYMGLTPSNFYARTEYYGYDEGMSFSGLNGNVLSVSQGTILSGTAYVYCRHSGTISRNAVLHIGGSLGYQSTSSWAQNASYYFF